MNDIQRRFGEIAADVYAYKRKGEEAILYTLRVISIQYAGCVTKVIPVKIGTIQTIDSRNRLPT